MKLLRPLSIIVLACLHSCSITTSINPKYLTFPLDYSAKLSFKPDSTTILLINRYSPDNKRFTGRKLRTLKSGAFTAIKYAETVLVRLPHVKVITLVDSATFSINTDPVKVLASKYHSDYVLVLTDYDANIFLDGVQNPNAYYNSVVAINFTLFEGNGIYYKKLNGTTSMAQSIRPYFGLLASLVIHPTVGGNRDSINSATKNAVFNALLDYLPHTVSYKRPLYNNASLKPSVTEILAGNFDKAHNLSEPLLRDRDRVTASKAAYNLAVVYEAQGDIDLAINMAQLSLDKYKNGYASTILSDLKKE